jgi:hypothetical protein
MSREGGCKRHTSVCVDEATAGIVKTTGERKRLYRFLNRLFSSKVTVAVRRWCRSTPME